MSARIVVLKFGSSVLRSEADLPAAVHEIYRWYREGRRVIAVVSAFEGVTDALLARARALDSEPEPHALAGFVATGEAATAQLLALALARSGVPAHALDPWHTGLRVQGPPLDATPSALDATPLLWRLEERPVAVVPGFVGTGPGGLCLLGRGGSDLTAVFLAQRLRAERCLLLKDVDGLYERDPALPGPRPRRFVEIPFDVALRLDGGIVQKKAIAFAQDHLQAFEVGAADAAETTVVGGARVRLERPQAVAPLRVALIGCGTVGGGVAERLRAQPERFDLVGVSSRSRGPAPQELLQRDFDVLVELTGAPEAGTWIRAALRAGRDVVSAHKELLALEGTELEALAEATGAELRHSAAVGGAAPMLEAVARGEVRSMQAALNGTTNYLLSRVEIGVALEDALVEARSRGLAEADPSRDLDGRDAASKLALLVRAAWSALLNPDTIPRVALSESLAERAREIKASKNSLRIIAVAADRQIELREAILPPGHQLATLTGAECGLLVRRTNGTEEFIRGRGAGRWPTAEAVLADLMDLRRLRLKSAGQRARLSCA
jgi:homoserine dehydrogenase